MPAGCATFLANIGQLPDGSESPGFDQLLAAAPVAVAPATNAAAPIKTGSAPAAEPAAPQIDMPRLEDAGSDEAPVLKTEPAKAPADAAADPLAATPMNHDGCHAGREGARDEKSVSGRVDHGGR